MRSLRKFVLHIDLKEFYLINVYLCFNILKHGCFSFMYLINSKYMCMYLHTKCKLNTCIYTQRRAEIHCFGELK